MFSHISSATAGKCAERNGSDCHVHIALKDTSISSYKHIDGGNGDGNQKHVGNQYRDNLRYSQIQKTEILVAQGVFQCGIQLQSCKGTGVLPCRIVSGKNDAVPNRGDFHHQRERIDNYQIADHQPKNFLKDDLRTFHLGHAAVGGDHVHEKEQDHHRCADCLKTGGKHIRQVV